MLRTPTSATDAGAHARFSTLYVSHAAFVRSQVRRCGVPDADIDDAVQEVFCVLLRRMSEVDAQMPLHGWLMCVTSFVCRNHRRSVGRRAKWLDSQTSLDVERCSVDSPPCATPLSPALEQLLARLDPHQRRVLLLTAFEERTAKEIAELLGISPNTVASRLRAARRKGIAHFALTETAAGSI